jgi:PAS domain S-box-containing protein
MAQSLDFMLKEGQEIFPGVPVVFCGIDSREIASRKLGPNATGVFLRRDFKGTLDLALKLRPQTQRFFLVAGTSDFDRELVKLAREDLHQFGDRITYITDLSLNETLEQVSKLPRDGIVLYLNMFRDGAGEHFDPYEVARRVSERANVPVFGHFDPFIGHGLIGGKVYGVEAFGKKAAELALRIIDGEKPAFISIVSGSPTVPIFDWRQLKRWNIALGSLPVGSEVRFRVPTFWEQYKGRVVAVSLVVIAQSALIVFLVVSRQRQRRAESGLSESEAELRETQRRMDLAARAADLGIWVWDVVRDEIWVSEKERALFGFAPSEKLDIDRFRNAIHPDDRASMRKALENSLNTGIEYEAEHRVLLPNGQIRWLATRGRVDFGGDGKPARLRGVSFDVTRRKLGEEALLESEGRFRIVADAAHLGVWEWDIATNEMWMSESARALFGFDSNTHLTHALLQNRLHPDDRARRDSIVKAAIENQGEYELEYRTILPDGRVRWIGGRGRCVRKDNSTRLIGVSIDITERKQAEEKFRLAVEASPSGIVLVDGEGKIVLVNAHVEELFGYRREELVGKLVDILVPERLRAGHPAHRAKFVAKPEAVVIGAGRELFARRKDGSQFPVEIGLNPIDTPDGILILAAVVDISARKVAEAEALHHREELSHLSRVAVMGEMAASIAHELNQPLSGIISNASAGQRFIDRGNVDLREMRDLLADIIADGRRAGDVIRGVRSMVKKSETARHRMDLNKVVMNVVRLIKDDALLRSCTLDTLLAPDLPAIEADPTQLQQVLINLVINAFDAMRDTPVNRRKVVIATEQNGDGTICTSVRDYGVGISEEKRARLFEQFFTTKAEGLGMGLSIVRSIVESHGGTVTAENADGGGARFQFTLPVNATAL